MKIHLIEDHDEALKIWRQNDFKGLDVVHVDAHIDLGYHKAKPIKKLIDEAESIKELKDRLEYSLAFMRYEKDFDKQTNIANFIYPAIEEGVIKNFYWVIPGEVNEFKKSFKLIKDILKGLLRAEGKKVDNLVLQQREKGIISTKLFGREFIVCVLEKLPLLRQDTLLDIDIDFLVIDSILNADSSINIGKRKPWILPQDLVKTLKEKVKNPKLVTIAYSVNGGWTPIKYKYFGDETAYHLSPIRFKRRLLNNTKASKYFNLFTATGKINYYKKALKLNPAYRVKDNNYGPLYLYLRRFSSAQKEFLKILKADPKNPACLWGLGNIALEKRGFKEAERYFSFILKTKGNTLFSKIKKEGLLGLARSEFNLGNFKSAKRLLFRYKALQPRKPQGYYFLGRIFEKEKKFEQSAKFYRDAFRLGVNNIEIIWRLLRISSHLKEKDGLIKYMTKRYNMAKGEFVKDKKLNLKQGKKIKGLLKTEKMMKDIEKRLKI